MAKRTTTEVVVPSSKAAARERRRRHREYDADGRIVAADAVERLRAVLEPLTENERRIAITSVAVLFRDKVLATACFGAGF
jgi:hypothetical protein